MLGLKSFFVFLGRNKKYTLINLIGLSVSLMFVLLIGNYIVDELTIDKEVKKADRIFLVANEKDMQSGFWIGQKLHDRYPEIENYCVIGTDGKQNVTVHDVKYAASYMCVDTSFFSMFSVKLSNGNQKDALISTKDVIISERFAREAFGDVDPIGKTIKFEKFGDKERIVTGVVPNLRNSVFPDFDILLNSLTIEDINPYITTERMSNYGAVVVFLQAKEGMQTQLMSRSNQMTDYFKESFWPYQGGGFLKEVQLIPFKDLHFSTLDSLFLIKGEKSLLMILLSVGVLILLFAVTNYINLTTAQAGFRAKEMATRRLLGSSRLALFGSLIMESFFMCVISFTLGLMLAYSLEPYANTLLHSKIDIIGGLSWGTLSIYFGAIVVLSVISGAVPAFVISNYKPIEVVRGVLRQKTSMVYSKFLIAFQNIITIALIGGSITMLWQVKHLMNAPLGYTYENIIDVNVRQGFSGYAQIKEAANKLRQLPCVEDIAFGCSTPLGGGFSNSFEYGPERFRFQLIRGDSTYFKMLNLRVKRDNHLVGSNRYFNEYAIKKLGIKETEAEFKFGKEFNYSMGISGILYDFRIRNMLNEPSACIIEYYRNYDDCNKPDTPEYERACPFNMLIKTKGDQNAAFESVKKVVLETTKEQEFRGKYMSDQLKESYSEQRRVSTIMLIFTFIAVLISMLGLFAMSTYYIQQRRKEVAIRKIFGSTSQQVLRLLTSSFMKIVGIAFVIAVPIIWYAMDWWLSDFAYRIALSPLIFVGAGVFASIFALITVYWQSRIAANANPVDSINN